MGTVTLEEEKFEKEAIKQFRTVMEIIKETTKTGVTFKSIYTNNQAKYIQLFLKEYKREFDWFNNVLSESSPENILTFLQSQEQQTERIYAGISTRVRIWMESPENRKGSIEMYKVLDAYVKTIGRLFALYALCFSMDLALVKTQTDCNLLIKSMKKIKKEEPVKLAGVISFINVTIKYISELSDLQKRCATEIAAIFS